MRALQALGCAGSWWGPPPSAGRGHYRNRAAQGCRPGALTTPGPASSALNAIIFIATCAYPSSAGGLFSLKSATLLRAIPHHHERQKEPSDTGHARPCSGAPRAATTTRPARCRSHPGVCTQSLWATLWINPGTSRQNRACIGLQRTAHQLGSLGQHAFASIVAGLSALQHPPPCLLPPCSAWLSPSATAIL